MNFLIKNKKYLRLGLIFILLIIPWSNANYFDDINADIVNHENTSFYEINTCEVSLIEFLLKNKTSIFEDNLTFWADDYSSIKCFGRVTGLLLEDNIIYISIGTNVLINLIIQSIFWMTIFSYIKKDKKQLKIDKKVYYQGLFLLTYFLVFIVYAERRFYESKFYYLKLTDFVSLSDKVSLLILFLIFFFIVKSLLDIALPRFFNLINYLPFIYLVIALNSGLNLNFYLIIFMFFGLISILKKEFNRKLNRYYLLFSIFWIFNASGSFYYPLVSGKYLGNLRGFSSSIYTFNSVLSWTAVVFFLVNGLLFFYRRNKLNVDLDKLLNSFSLASISVLIFGYIGSAFQITNFLNYYYFGQKKFAERISDPLSLNELVETNSWNGFYSSTKSIGEFYGIVIILTIFRLIKERKISRVNSLGVISSLLGLYLSNNLFIVFFIILVSIYFLFKEVIQIDDSKIKLLVPVSLIIFFIVIYQNLDDSHSYISESIITEALTYQIEIESSFLKLLITSFGEKTLLYVLFVIFGYISYLFNSTDFWAIFTAKYNPTFLELFVGSGPFNYGQYFHEIKIIQKADPFLVPHSSFLSLVIFIGLFGVIFLSYFILSKVIKNRGMLNSYGSVLLIYLGVNLFFNDSINYFSSFTLYTFLIYIILNLDNIKLFDFTKSKSS
tara:strand:+ start:1812 stop:3812 length:2001 start_codon:yes stop_codon:yes gene_type:complete